MNKTTPIQPPTPSTETELPVGWAQVPLSELCRSQSGNSKLIKGKLYSEPGEGRFLAYSASGPDVFCDDYEHEGVAIIVSAVGARCGKAFKASGKWSAIANTHIVWPETAIIDPEYLFMHLNNEDFWEKGGSAQPFVRVKATLERLFDLPPLTEQKRIVAKVEMLFAQVNATQARLARLPAIIKRFRQSVLAAACSGRLTAEWREGHDGGQLSEDAELPSLWERLPLRELCDGFEYGSSRKSDGMGNVPVLRMGNLQDGKIDWSDLKYSSDAAEIAKYSLKSNTVLFNRTNSPELVGKTAIYRGERPAIFAGYLIRVIHGPRINPDFLNYSLNTQDFREYCMQVKSDGVSQSNINAKKLASYEIALPPLDEQHEIVRRVGALFAMADGIEAHIRAATVRAERLPQAILARAFRGELVPNEAELAAKDGRDYETAAVLLKKFAEARQQLKPAKRGRGGKKMVRRSATRQAAMKQKPLDEVLREQGKSLTPESLFDLAGFNEDSVDGFYEQLRNLIQAGIIRENRPNKKDIILEAVGK